MSNFEKVIQKIDEFNRQDPFGRELTYSLHLTEWILRLDPKASLFLRIAARGQHMGRWTVPRESYPDGRQGYLKWRTDLKKFHAQKVSDLMKVCGYENEDIQKVSEIILKRDLKNNPDAQTMEDAVSLVFLEKQYLEFKKKTPEDKMKDILKKTWRKMSPRGQSFALQLPLPPQELEFIKSAIE